MDVFISEEYVNRRRVEKKAAAATVAGRNMKLGFGSTNRPEKRKTNPRPENEFLVYESFVFQCFSP
ncbi:unnamed protein product [Cochlearia groenlandica]